MTRAITDEPSLGCAVANWHRATFGEDCSALRVGKKTLEEAAELFVALQGTFYPAQLRELADVAITLHALAYRLGVSLDSVTEARLHEIAARTDQIERDAERGIDP